MRTSRAAFIGADAAAFRHGSAVKGIASEYSSDRASLEGRSKLGLESHNNVTSTYCAIWMLDA